MEWSNELEREFRQRMETLGPLGEYVETLVRQLLSVGGVRSHTISHRLKSLASTREKLGREEKPYASLDELHDLLGIRIVTYFPDEVDAVARVIEQEFAIQEDESVDRRAALDPDRFGYISLHYVVRLTDDRCKLRELSRYAGQPFEIQIRSILQHAWAEIEHDFGYKTRQAIPRSIKRRFARLAGLLEVADSEFQAIREDAIAYQKQVAEEVRDRTTSVGIDQDSLRAFVAQSKAVHRGDETIAAYGGGEPLEPARDSFLGHRAATLQQLGLTTIEEVASALDDLFDVTMAFAKDWLEGREHSFVSGISLFYLAYVVAARTLDEPALREWLQRNRMYGVDAQKVLGTYRRALKAAKGASAG